MKERPDLFLEAPPDALKMKRKAISSCREEIMRSKGQKTPQLVKDALTKADWEGMGRSCISCGGCSYVCPTCHCFNISDQGTPDGERVRCADTCILSGFSRMTSGVNPRRSAGERLRNWFMDKFEFIPRRTGLLGCVGCGRCSVVCLSGSDRWEWLL
jgi:ferredoxin